MTMAWAPEEGGTRCQKKVGPVPERCTGLGMRLTWRVLGAQSGEYTCVQWRSSYENIDKFQSKQTTKILVL